MSSKGIEVDKLRGLQKKYLDLIDSNDSSVSVQSNPVTIQQVIFPFFNSFPSSMNPQNVIRTVPVYKDSIKRGEVRILVNTNQSSAAKKPFRTQAVLSSSSSSGPSSTITSSSLIEKQTDPFPDRARQPNHGTPIPCKRSFPPLLASLAASSPSPPKMPANSVSLPCSGSSSSYQSYDMSSNASYASSSSAHTLASLTARSNSSRSRQSNHSHNQLDSDASEMTPNSKSKHRYETSLGQLTKKFICLLKEAPEGVSSLLN